MIQKIANTRLFKAIYRGHFFMVSRPHEWCHYIVAYLFGMNPQKPVYEITDKGSGAHVTIDSGNKLQSRMFYLKLVVVCLAPLLNLIWLIPLLLWVWSVAPSEILFMNIYSVTVVSLFFLLVTPSIPDYVMAWKFSLIFIFYQKVNAQIGGREFKEGEVVKVTV